MRLVLWSLAGMLSRLAFVRIVPAPAGATACCGDVIGAFQRSPLVAAPVYALALAPPAVSHLVSTTRAGDIHPAEPGANA